MTLSKPILIAALALLAALVFSASPAFAGKVTSAVPGEPGFVDVGLFIDTDADDRAETVADTGDDAVSAE